VTPKESFNPGAEQRGWRCVTRTGVQLNRLIGVVRNRVEELLSRMVKTTFVMAPDFWRSLFSW